MPLLWEKKKVKEEREWTEASGRERRGSRSRAAASVGCERKRGIDRREKNASAALKTSSVRDLVPSFCVLREATIYLMHSEGEERRKGHEDGP